MRRFAQQEARLAKRFITEVHLEKLCNFSYLKKSYPGRARDMTTERRMMRPQ